MSTEMKELEAHVVFKNPQKGDRKKMVEPMFPVRFRTAPDLKKAVDGWAKGQWTSMSGLAVEVLKPDKRHRLWRAEVLHAHGVLAEIVFWPPRAASAPEPEGLLP